MYAGLLNAISQNDLIPNGFCIRWSQGLMIAYLVSDSIIFLSCLSIPIALVYFAQKRTDLNWGSLLWLFSALILACGTTYLLSMVTLWQPVYWLDASVKAVTAVVAAVTACYLWRRIPDLLAIPDRQQLLELNRQLSAEVERRNRSEQELQKKHLQLVESERNLRAMYDNLPFLAWMKDHEGRYISANRLWLQNANIPSIAGLAGKTDFDIWPEELARHYRNVDQVVMRTRSQVSLIEKSLDGGIEHSVETLKSPVIDEQGEVHGTIGLARDITEKLIQEQHLQKLSERLQLATKAANMGVCEWDLKTDLIHWDDRMYEIFGLPSGSAITYEIWRELIVPEDLPYAEAKLCGSLRDSMESNFDFRILRKSDGSLRFIRAAATAGYDTDGGLSKLVGVNFDVTELKLTEIALKNSEANLARAQAQAHIGSWVIDMAEQTLNWSDETYRIFGIQIDAPVSYEAFISIVHPDDRESVEQAWKAALRGEDYDIQHRIVVDGKVKWIRELAELEFAADGRMVRCIGTCHDITKIKEAEIDLELSHAQISGLVTRIKRAQEEERKRISREVHDELGQMLTALRMDISLIRINFTGANQQLAEHLQKTMELMDKTIKVTRDVATSLRPAVIDMGIIPALEWLAENFQDQSGISCKLSIDEQILSFDEERSIEIYRIVQESLTNVSRHANATKVRISLLREGDLCSLEILDNGHGFDLNVPRKQRSFGLIGIKERVKMLSGQVTISSMPGQGTCIRVLFPFHENT